jgi:hypothetical protein
MSRGYTRALARTAPVEPAIAKPQGGSGAGFDRTAIAESIRRGFCRQRLGWWEEGEEAKRAPSVATSTRRRWRANWLPAPTSV